MKKVAGNDSMFFKMYREYLGNYVEIVQIYL